MVKNILFDLGGVITETKFEDVIKKYSLIYGLEVDGLKERIFCREYELLLTGKLTLSNFIDYLNKVFARVDRRELESFVMEYYEAEYLKDGIRELLLDINDEFRLVLITNDIGLLDAKLKRFGIDSIFDNVINSYDTGYLKPNVEVYRYALDHLGALEGECLYIDNSTQALNVASQLGIRTLKSNGIKELEGELKAMDLINK